MKSVDSKWRLLLTSIGKEEIIYYSDKEHQKINKDYPISLGYE